ncbi:hypothetical protein [Arthrobacter sp. StoSoilB20]|uniref:hypothetical protein n=1 Tax=Arthrobacter sp. StoSoilB20 TaxID=2830995 RepID=UPI001CC36B79|nr:hypothetical protein [Arthrobacter sp. StoSoilB20]BCW58569.1 hypothetical protein StoSoilB20_19160 [Arthrobacter sp. StoSoilB20]
MTKYLLWYAAVPGKQAELQEWLNTRFADAVLHSTSGVASFRVNLALPEPDCSERFPTSETDVAAIVEVTYASDGKVKLSWLNQLVRRALIQFCHVYEVEDCQVLDTSARKPRLPSRGYQLIQGFSYSAETPVGDIRPSWRSHRAPVDGDHDESTRSIRIRRAVTSGAPELQFVSVIGFPSFEGLGDLAAESVMGKEVIKTAMPTPVRGGTQQIFASLAREFVFLSDGERVEAEPWTMWPLP